jgi:tungstate transport system substrate-binding protein
LEDAGEAFRRIAASKRKFVLNDIDGIRYLTDILWNAAGRPDRSGWFLDEGHRKDGAIDRASEIGAYAFWGLTPFLRLSGQRPLKLEPLVLADPLLQRLIVSVVVKPSKVPGVNAEGARALQSHLLSPSTQAQIRSIRYPGDKAVCWVPAGRNNRIAVLPKG